MADVVVGSVEDLPPGQVKIVRAGELSIGVYNAGGDLYAIEDRCTHDDGVCGVSAAIPSPTR